jgi:tetratricopeptide (TPR) repeat protein/transcriptional regulator with XRE-family HTH domain
MANESRPQFASLLRRFRLAAGLTQEALAERAHLSARAISDLERGLKRSPRRDTVELLETALSLSPRERAAFEMAARGFDPGVQGNGSNPDAQAEPLPSAGSGVAGDADQPSLIGRDNELALLALHAQRGCPPLLLFAGEPGIGKSRLLHEAATVAANHGYQVLVGGCIRRHGQEPFEPFLEAMDRYLRQLDPVQLRSALRGCAWLIRLLPELKDGPIESPVADSLAPAQERRLIFQAVAQFLRNVAGPNGIMLVLDDLQWIGPDALDLLQAMLRNGSDLPIRVVGAYRDTELIPGDPLALALADLTRSGVVLRSPVEPLNAAESRSLLDSLPESSSAGWPALRQRILNRAEGVPFYLVSCATALSRGNPENDVPWDVAQSIRQRVDLLTDPARTVVRSAAVVGRVADANLVVSASELSDEEAVAALDEAVQSRLIEWEGPLSLRFPHDLIREVVEADLGPARRAFLHRRIARLVESAWHEQPEREDLPADLLAYHFEHGGEPEAAIDYAIRAADFAHRAGAHREEVALIGRAIDLAEPIWLAEATAGLRIDRGRAYFDFGMWSEARADLEAGLAGLPANDLDRQCRALVDLAWVCHWLFDVPATRRHASDALALARKLRRDDLIAEAMSAAAFAESSEGELKSSLRKYRSALAITPARSKPRLVPAAEMRSLILYWTGSYEDAIRHGQEALIAAQEAGDTTYTARVLGNLGLAFTGRGRYGDAIDAFGEARRFCREHELSQWLARSVAMEGGLHLAMLDYAGAEDLANEARELGLSIAWPLAVVSADIDLLLNFARRGDPGGRTDQLLRDAAEAAAAATGAHGWLWKLRLAEARAEIALARGDISLAGALASDAVAQARVLGRAKYVAIGLTTRASALERLGQVREAVIDLHEAVHVARSTADPSVLLQALLPLNTIDGNDQLAAEIGAVAAQVARSLPSEDMRDRFLSGLSRFDGGERVSLEADAGESIGEPLT